MRVKILVGVFGRNREVDPKIADRLTLRGTTVPIDGGKQIQTILHDRDVLTEASTTASRLDPALVADLGPRPGSRSPRVLIAPALDAVREAVRADVQMARGSRCHSRNERTAEKGTTVQVDQLIELQERRLAVSGMANANRRQVHILQADEFRLADRAARRREVVPDIHEAERIGRQHSEGSRYAAVDFHRSQARDQPDAQGDVVVVDVQVDRAVGLKEIRVGRVHAEADAYRDIDTDCRAELEQRLLVGSVDFARKGDDDLLVEVVPFAVRARLELELVGVDQLFGKSAFDILG